MGYRFNRGIAKNRTGDYQGAIEDLSFIIEKNDKNYINFIERGKIIEQFQFESKDDLPPFYKK